MKAAVKSLITYCESIKQKAKQEKFQIPQCSVYEVSLGEGQAS